MLSAWYTLQLLHEAGLPKGVINFLPGDPVMISDIALKHRDLAGVHFTGSTGVFNSMWSTIGQNMSNYRSYPRIVGETGGKDFIIAHPSADVEAFAVAVVRGGFEYQGQKCSACSRIYVPKSLWPEVKERVRIRLGNLSPMEHHPIHLHGLNFVITETDGGRVPLSAQYPETTVLVPVGTTRVIEFVPTEPGDWAMHCHMTHHTMTQMGHDIPVMLGVNTKKLDQRMSRVTPEYMSMGTTGMGGMGEMNMPIPPNSLPMRGADGPFGYIDMGGMFTVLKGRDDPNAADPNAWFTHPAGTVAARADAAKMRTDGIVLPAVSRAPGQREG